MSLKDELQFKRGQLQKIAEENGITKISIFGSVLREEERTDSDIDFLVEIQEDRSLFDLIRFKHSVEELVQRKVDVVTAEAIHWSIRDQVLNEAVQL